MAAPCYVWSHFYYLLLIVNLLIYSIKMICTKLGGVHPLSIGHPKNLERCNKKGKKVIENKQKSVDRCNLVSDSAKSGSLSNYTSRDSDPLVVKLPTNIWLESRDLWFRTA